MEPKDTDSGDVVQSPDVPQAAEPGENLTPAAPSAPVPPAPADVPPAPVADEQEIAAESATESAAEPAPDTVRRRPRGRTSLIVLAAAVLGVAIGGAVGYGVQADRDPTPLGPLAHARLAYPTKPGKVADPLPVAQDRQVKTDGDLTKLLLPAPKGAEVDEDFGRGFLTLSDYASEYESPDYMFDDLLGSGIRRIAEASWSEGENRETKVDLVQYRSDDSLGAADHFASQMNYLPYEDGADNDGDPVKGSLDGRYFIYPVHREAGYLPMYEARAIAVRGDIVMDISVFDSEPISKKTIRSLAERQLERL
ncbi:hypothetical protein [Streptomyces sp. NBC_00102]|uniref:hypothetical protein n=1 Tax=Streptomyces sp. NBC_00102 TaxID=2975652 RepID=UPI00224F2AEB|nr:hypothetical protein [Streptomyces sp. NBC_00102]MCX5397981.1 hypothetical protein [Streptomyces sp. NBC_00102]